MSNQEVFVDFLIYRVLLIYLKGEVFAEFLEHFLKDLELHLMDSGQDLNSNGLVNREHLLMDWASVSCNNPSGFLVLSLLEEHAGEPHKVVVEYLRALFLGEVEAVLPLAPLLEHVQAGQIAALNDLVDLPALDQHQLLLTLDLINQHVLQLDRPDLASTVSRTVPFVRLGEGLNSLVIVAD